jgi:oligopeptide/dipeptide ABC transporter ATP-binding protein
VRAGIIQLLLKLKQAHQMSLLFVTHDLSLAWAIGDRVAVMYAGRLLEVGTPEQVIAAPAHPYSSALVSAIPEADPDLPLRPMSLTSESSSAASPSGCCFRLRCPYAQPECAVGRPPLESAGNGHLTACIRHLEIRSQLPRMEVAANAGKADLSGG